MSEENKMDETKEVSRRNFLAKAGILTTGFAVAGGLFSSYLDTAEGAESSIIPWPYAKLDLASVRKAGFDGYFEGGCCYGAAKGLVSNLQKVLGTGTQWDTLPIDMFKIGAGGVLSWGTLCGALNGALFVVNIATGKNFGGVGNDLIGWYTKYPFPSTAMDSYTDPNGASFKKQIRTVANSPLCHNSVSLWCDASGKKVNSDEKKHRCAKLTGETAARAAYLLNALLVDKTFVAAFQTDSATQDCMTCHTSTSRLDDEQGKMACAPCHTTLQPVKHDHTLFNDNDCGICHK